jgi:hypothetical protein
MFGIGRFRADIAPMTDAPSDVPTDAKAEGAAYEQLFPKVTRRHRWMWMAVGLALLCGTLVAGVAWDLTARRPIASSGGLYFFQAVELPVPGFRQGDPRWKVDPLGNTTDTIGSAGCAVTSAAMVMKWYGVDTDPQRLNQYATAHHGYVGSAWLVWESPARLTKGGVKKAYEDPPSYWRIDRQLMQGNPVIVRLHLPGGTTHFVVIAGKRGFDYLIRDPGAGWSRGLYPLRDLTPSIDGLRYYKRKVPAKTASA